MANVLIIDDAAHVRLLLRELLEQAGHRVNEATDGQSGLDLMADEAFDLAIVDVIMPGVDGVTVIKQARSVSPRTTLLAISGGSAEMPADLSLKMSEMFGADAVLYKPFDNAEFLAAVERLLSSRGGAPNGDASAT